MPHPICMQLKSTCTEPKPSAAVPDIVVLAHPQLSRLTLRHSVLRLSTVLVILTGVLTACAGVVMEGAHITHDTSVRNNNMQAALDGDPEAQYRVGKSYCCAPRNEADAFYNNRKAIEFLCRAARQHHALAAFELGKIYAGDTIEGLRLLRRAATQLRGDDFSNTSLAYYWFKQSQLNGYTEASQAMDALGPQDISHFLSPESTPCTLTEVLGDS